MKIIKKYLLFLYLLIVTVAVFFTPLINADSSQQFFPMYPRITGQAMDSTNSNMGIFNIDAMAPVYGSADNILYVNGIGNYGTDNSSLESFGIGIRNIVNNNWLLGGYLFCDRNQAQNNGEFQVLNPGLEFMYNHWDFHINGYLPINESKFESYGLASFLGNSNYLSFYQHAEFDNIVAKQNVIGKGSDVETGYSIPFNKNRIRIFIGGYFYAPSGVSNITGTQGGIEFPLAQRIKLVMQDSYDNVFHNTIALAIQFTLGGKQSVETDQLQDRILDPIPRHLGTLHTGAGVLSQQQLKNTGQPVMIENNLWFFQPGTGNLAQVVTDNSCTFENPCIGLGQTTINGINNISPNAKFYLAPGLYNNALVGNGFTLNMGQSIFGRTQNYKQSAQGNQRALVNDTLFLNGNNVVANLQINGQSDEDVSRLGIVATKSAIGTMQIYNSNITAMGTAASYEAIGVYNSSLNATVWVQNSTIIANAPALSEGVFNEDFGQVNIVNSTVVSNASRFSEGVFNEDFGQVNIINSTISGNASTLSKGVVNEDFGQVNIINSTIGANAFDLSEGISNEDFGQINIENSHIVANGFILSEGLFNEDFGGINVVNSSVISNGFIFSEGIFNEDFGRIALAKSSIASNAFIFPIGVFNEDFSLTNVLNSSIAIHSPIFNS